MKKQKVDKKYYVSYILLIVMFIVTVIGIQPDEEEIQLGDYTKKEISSEAFEELDIKYGILENTKNERVNDIGQVVYLNDPKVSTKYRIVYDTNPSRQEVKEEVDVYTQYVEKSSSYIIYTVFTFMKPIIITFIVFLGLVLVIDQKGDREIFYI